MWISHQLKTKEAKKKTVSIGNISFIKLPYINKNNKHLNEFQQGGTITSFYPKNYPQHVHPNLTP